MGGCNGNYAIHRLSVYPLVEFEITGFASKAKKALNKARKSGRTCHRIRARLARGIFNRELLKAKALGWRNYCAEIRNTPVASRLTKVLERSNLEMFGALQTVDGAYTERDEEILNVLVTEHFPEIEIENVDDALSGGEHSRPTVTPKSDELDDTRIYWNEANKIAAATRIGWAIQISRPYKAPGPDGIYPKLLKKAFPYIKDVITKLMRASLAIGHVPKDWCQTEVIFLPKPGRDKYTTPKSFRPISLTSHTLKILERIVDRYIKDTYLTVRELHAGQHAYRIGRSVETAVHCLVTGIETALLRKDITLACFVDIEGAFNKTTTRTIIRALKEHGVSDMLVRWINTMLLTRNIQTRRGEVTLSGKVYRGCPQGGILSPLLWSLVVDELLEAIKACDIRTLAYADDVVFWVEGKNEKDMRERMQRALDTLETWCDVVNLSVNPEKIELIRITRRIKKPQFRGLQYQGRELALARKVKYLGITLNSTLTWREHVFTKLKRARINMNMVCRAIGSTWGLSPAMMKWIYLMIIKPRITFGANMWWRAARLATVKEKLNVTQGMALRRVLGTMRTTPTRAMESLLDIPPLDIVIQELAMRTMLRLRIWGHWLPGPDKGHGCILEEIGTQEINAIQAWPFDTIPKRFLFEKFFRLRIPTDRNWNTSDVHSTSDIVWYTDGSKDSNDETGSGWCAEKELTVWGYKRLGSYATVFQAEVSAIQECVNYMLTSNITNTAIAICTDSRAALLALDGCQFTSLTAWNCKRRIDELGKRNILTLWWVPGHEGIKGNERADRLARIGTKFPPENDADIPPISLTTYKGLIR